MILSHAVEQKENVGSKGEKLESGKRRLTLERWRWILVRWMCSKVTLADTRICVSRLSSKSIDLLSTEGLLSPGVVLLLLGVISIGALEVSCLVLRRRMATTSDGILLFHKD